MLSFIRWTLFFVVLFVAVIGGALLRNGPLVKKDAAPAVHSEPATGQATAGPALPA